MRVTDKKHLTKGKPVYYFGLALQLPLEFRYITTDLNGNVYAFKTKPVPYSCGMYNVDEWVLHSDYCIGGSLRPSDDFEDGVYLGAFELDHDDCVEDWKDTLIDYGEYNE